MYNGLITQEHYDQLSETEKYKYKPIYQWYRRATKVWEDDYEGMATYPVFKNYVQHCQRQKIRKMYRLIPGCIPEIEVREIVVTKEVEVVREVYARYDVSNVLREFEELGRQLRATTNNPHQLAGIQLTLSALEKLLSKHNNKPIRQ